MASYVAPDIANGQAVTADPIALKHATLTAAAATAVVKIYGNGVELLRLSAAATTTTTWGIGGNQVVTKPFPGPVTIDLSGTGAFFQMDY